MYRGKFSKESIYKRKVEERIKEISRLYYTEHKTIEELSDLFHLSPNIIYVYLKYQVPVLIKEKIIPLDYLNGFYPGTILDKNSNY